MLGRRAGGVRQIHRNQVKDRLEPRRQLVVIFRGYRRGSGDREVSQQAFDKGLMVADPGDSLMAHFSGHGLAQPAEAGRLFGGASWIGGSELK